MLGFFKKKSTEVNELLERIELVRQGIPDELAHLTGPLLDLLTSTVKTKWKQEYIDNYAAQIRLAKRIRHSFTTTSSMPSRTN